MDNVFVVLDVDWNDVEILGIFTTLEKAQEVTDKMSEKYKKSFTIKEFVIDKFIEDFVI